MESFIAYRLSAGAFGRRRYASYTLPYPLHQRLLRRGLVRCVNGIAAETRDGKIVEHVWGQHEMLRQLLMFGREIKPVQGVEIDEAIPECKQMRLPLGVCPRS